MASKLGMTVDLCMVYMLMLVSMTLTLIHRGHRGSAKTTIQCWIILTTKQATSIKLATTVGHFYMTLTLQTFIRLDQLVFSPPPLPTPRIQTFFCIPPHRIQLQQEKSSSMLVLYHFVDSPSSISADPIIMIRRLTAQVRCHLLFLLSIWCMFSLLNAWMFFRYLNNYSLCCCKWSLGNKVSIFLSLSVSLHISLDKWIVITGLCEIIRTWIGMCSVHD